MKRMMLASLRFYKRNVSPLLPPACRFVPTCSEYARTAVERFGPTYGGYLVRLELEKRDTLENGQPRLHPQTRLSNCGYCLYWVSRPNDNNFKHNYRILPIDIPDSVLTGMEQKNRYAIRASMRRLMERHAKGVSEYQF